jgi:acetyl coenzyme A synthetase (ADP forming)-like protein
MASTVEGYDRPVAVPYPAHREADVVLRDGSTAHLRPVRREDRKLLRSLFERLSVDARTFRFFSGAADLEAAAAELSEVDYGGRYGLVARRGAGAPVGHGTYMQTAPGRAEVAFAVADEMQGLGLGTILLAHLAEAAAEAGIQVFVAEVLPQNHRMVDVFRQSGFPIDVSSEPGAVHIELATSFGPDAVERFEDRDRLAAAAAVRHFTEPRAVAVIGASRRRGTVGGEVFHNLIDSGFDGVVYPVNPAADVVQSVRAYRTIAEIPDRVDLAVIAVPAAAVIPVARECGESAVSGLIVLSAGFAETGAGGAELQRDLVEVCRSSGMRLVGPNCLGVSVNLPGSPLNATFAPGAPPPGNVGFVSQSGALGLALIELARDRGLGVSSFASIGNRADLTGNDLLEYWEDDPATDVALLYIESFSDPGRFSRVARRVGRRKPVAVVKSGRTVAGERAAGSHTGALLSASDVTVDALFEQAGVIRTETLAELLDVASLLSSQPLPRGPGVGILTNAGGPGIMCADACDAAGLEVPELPADLRDSLAEFLPAEAGLSNPVDMIATASAEQYRRSIELLSLWDGIEALIVIFIRPLLTRAEEVARSVREAVNAMERRLPVQAVFMSEADRRAMAGAGVPTYLYPEDAARTLGRVMRHVRWRERPLQEPRRFGDTRPDEASAIIAAALKGEDAWLGAEEIAALLDCYGIRMPDWQLAADPAAAAHAAEELGTPVALKAQGPQILHKSEIGAIRTGLQDATAVAGAAVQIDEALAAAGLRRASFLVQSMAEGSVEMLVGIANDPAFGPVLACGAGGTRAELHPDIAVRICPVCAAEAGEMLRSLATFPLLTGFRGEPAVDLLALEELLERVSAMVEAHREIVELDLNPVIAGPGAATAVDARVRVRPAPRPRPWPSTWKPMDAAGGP